MERRRRDFWETVDKTESCWIWTGVVRPNGYGQLSWLTRNRLAHRYAYETLVGPISPGLHLDHLCRNRACVNPDHLEPVTPTENILRGEGAPAQNARKTHCKYGHPLAGSNLVVERTGKRQCRICCRFRKAKHLAAKEAA